MKKTNQQQKEFNKIRKLIFITFFGSDKLPEKTKTLLLALNYYDFLPKLENKLLFLMRKNGMINKKLLRKKYADISNILDIPDEDFYISAILLNLMKELIPGVII